MKKVMLILLAVMFVASSAWAGTIPEFDAVGCDATNVFAKNNAVQYGQVIDNNIGPNGPINDFSVPMCPEPVLGPGIVSGRLLANCPRIPALGVRVVERPYRCLESRAVYEWYIILQMKPESDLNLNIYDCVLKHNEFSPWVEAARADWAVQSTTGVSFSLFLRPTPALRLRRILVSMLPLGSLHRSSMDARTLPGLDIVALDDVALHL